MDMLAIIANFALFQGAWFAAILGGATGQEFLGCLPALGAVILYLFLNKRRFGREVALLVGIGLLGAAFETVLIAAGWIAYTGSAQDSILPPIWIFALWLAFATLPHRSLQWLRGRPWLQGALGAVSGPLSYLAGVNLVRPPCQTPRQSRSSLSGWGGRSCFRSFSGSLIGFLAAGRLKTGVSPL
jgi:hypothetical protein